MGVGGIILASALAGVSGIVSATLWAEGSQIVPASCSAGVSGIVATSSSPGAPIPSPDPSSDRSIKALQCYSHSFPCSDLFLQQKGVVVESFFSYPGMEVAWKYHCRLAVQLVRWSEVDSCQCGLPCQGNN